MMLTYIISSLFFEPAAANFLIRNFSASKVGSPEIVIITIDDKSVGRKRWPWKRDMYSKIFAYLNDYTKAKVIGFDAIISTPDKENPQADASFYKSIKGLKNLVVGFMPLSTPYPNKEFGTSYDKMFADAFSVDILDKRTDSQKKGGYFKSLSTFPAEYFKSLNNVGCINATADSDGYVRSMDQFVGYNNNLYPSLAMRMYLYLNNNPKVVVENEYINIPETGLKIPVHSYYNTVFNYLKYYKLLPDIDYSHKIYSAIDIIDSYENMKNGKKPLIHPSEFEDKIVFVGANAKAAALGLEDVRQTPILQKHPGVDIQATNLDNLIHKDIIHYTSTWVDIFIAITLIAFVFYAISYFSLFVSIGLLTLLIVLYLLICVICFRYGFYIDVLTPVILQVITMVFAYSYKFTLENRNKEKIKQAMGKYISQDIMQDVVKNIDKVKLGGKKANLTVLFADIRGFTSLSEKMSAEDVSKILNEYFTEIEPIITEYNGVINKFIGDAVMAIFGEPIQDKKHATNAVKCANAMLKKVEQLQQKWLSEGKPKIEIGVGINTGDAFVGNIGSEKRMEYTVIGDMVNLASRIESYNKVYKTNFLISESTYLNVRNLVDVIKISEVTIRGKTKKMNIYEVLRVI